MPANGMYSRRTQGEGNSLSHILNTKDSNANINLYFKQPYLFLLNLFFLYFFSFVYLLIPYIPVLTEYKWHLAVPAYRK